MINRESCAESCTGACLTDLYMSEIYVSYGISAKQIQINPKERVLKVYGETVAVRKYVTFVSGFVRDDNVG